MKRNDSDKPNKKEAAPKPAPALTWARLMSPSFLMSVIFKSKMPQEKSGDETSSQALPLEEDLPKIPHKYAKEAREILTDYGSFPRSGSSAKKPPKPKSKITPSKPSKK